MIKQPTDSSECKSSRLEFFSFSWTPCPSPPPTAKNEEKLTSFHCNIGYETNLELCEEAIYKDSSESTSGHLKSDGF